MGKHVVKNSKGKTIGTIEKERHYPSHDLPPGQTITLCVAVLVSIVIMFGEGFTPGNIIFCSILTILAVAFYQYLATILVIVAIAMALEWYNGTLNPPW